MLNTNVIVNLWEIFFIAAFILSLLFSQLFNIMIATKTIAKYIANKRKFRYTVINNSYIDI